MEVNPIPRVLIQEVGSRPDSFIYHANDGFYYTVNGGSESSIWFRCSIRSCSGTAVLHQGLAFQHSQQHDHPPDPLRHRVQTVRRAIMNRAASIKYVSFVEIVQDERRRIVDRELRALITYRRLRSAMHRSRGNSFPIIPETIVELTQVLEDPEWVSLTTTLDNEDRVYCCSVSADDRSHNIIFASARGLELLRQVTIIFVDGTFSITPAIGRCYQVFTIVTIMAHTVIPLVWCLMESKSQRAYVAVLSQLRARLIRWNFQLAVSDYEDAIINALEDVFGVEVQGCYFHYVNVRKAHGMVDLCGWAKTTLTPQVVTLFPQVILLIRQCCSLPLLPQYLLQRGMDVVWMAAMQSGPVVMNIITPFLQYVQGDWINHVNRGRTLSCCGSYHRTNNASESNNQRMNKRMQVAHPNVYHFIRNIVEFEDSTVDDIRSLNIGLIPNRHRKPVAVSNDLWIQSLTSNLLRVRDPTNADIADFLNGAAYCMENVMFEALGMRMGD